MNKGSIRENRYIVLKRTDVNQLSEQDRTALGDLLKKVNDIRVDRGKPISNDNDLEYVVVERDWPEYEPTWQMIEDRVNNG